MDVSERAGTAEGPGRGTRRLTPHRRHTAARRRRRGPGGRCGTWPPNSPPTAAPPHAPPARPGTSSATTASPRPGNKARDSPWTTRWPTPPARAAAANAPPPAAPACPRPNERSSAWSAKACATTPSPGGCSSPPAPSHRPRHRQGAPVPHLRQARHHHPRRTGRTGSLARSDRQMIWRVRHRSLFAPPHPIATEDDPPPPTRDNLHVTAQATDMAIKPRRFGIPVN
jgi:hypothetical protein